MACESRKDRYKNGLYFMRGVRKKRGIPEKGGQKLCEAGRIPDAVKFSRIWLIPKDAKKSVDGRRKNI